MKPIKSIILLSAIALYNFSLSAFSPTAIQTQTRSEISKSPVRLSALYLNVAYNALPTTSGVSVNASFMLNTGWGGSIGEKQFKLGSKNKPADYDGGFILFFSANNPPPDKISTLYFTVNKCFQHKSNRIRIGIEAGPSLVNYSETFFSEKKRVDPTFMSRDANYNHYQKDYSSLGFYSKVKVEIPIFRYVGIQFSTFTDMNQFKNLHGFEIGLMVGLLRD